MPDSNNFCPRCGAAVIADARFCARCGFDFAAIAPPAANPLPATEAAAPVAPPPQTAPPDAPRRSAASRSGLILVAFGLLLVVIVFSFWMMRPRRTATMVTDSAETQSFPQPTERTGRKSPPAPIVEAPAGAPAGTIEVIDEPDPSSTLPPAQPNPQPQATRTAKVTEGDAVGKVVSHIRSTDYYEIPTTCWEARSLGYENVGYTVEIRGICADIGNEGRLLGRWRVDAITGELFVQKADGRFLRP